MSASDAEMLEARVALVERRLQLLYEEVTAVLDDPPRRVARGAKAAGDTPVFPSAVEFDADSLSQFAQGFYQREYDADGGAFRWTGSGPICELRFFLDRSADRAFRMNVGDTAAFILSRLIGHVDYAPIPLAVDKEGPARFVSGVIPKRQHTRLAVLTFLLGRVPAKKGKPQDADQWLGFRFYSLQVGETHAAEE
jgi:hypothetical protein